MATKHDVKGVTAKRKPIIVIPKESNPSRQFMSKAEALKDNARLKKANEAAEEARKRVLNEKLGESDDESQKSQEVKEPVVSKSEEKIILLRKKLANAESKFSENPQSKSWQKKVQEISEELEAAEAESTE